MLFTYSFGEKLDLEKFQKQASHYIGSMREINYHLYLPHYKITLEIAGLDNSTSKIITALMADLERDADGEVKKEYNIFPLLDTRFKENPDIQAVFTVADNYRGSFTTSHPANGVEKICRIVKLLHKLDHLKAFL